MYESKIFVQCVIQLGADSAAPEWEEDGQLTSPRLTFLQEASKPQPCVCSVDMPLLRSLPGDSYWQTLLDCDIITTSVLVCWRVGGKWQARHQSEQACECSVAQSCPPLCEPMNCNLPDSSVRGIPQARILEWVDISFSTGSSRSRDRIHVSCISCLGRQTLYYWVTWESYCFPKLLKFLGSF